MLPLSAVPMSTLPGCSEGAIANAVTVDELQTTSVAPSGRMRNTALRAVETSFRLRVCAAWPWAVAPASSMAVIVTEVVGVAPSVGCDGVTGGVEGGRAVDAASLKARA